MIKINHETIKIPDKIRQWVWDNLEEISDEICIEKNGEYLLAYEGWSGFCVSKVFEMSQLALEGDEL